MNKAEKSQTIVLIACFACVFFVCSFNMELL